MGDENGFLDYQKYYPSKAFQLNWIQAYLENWHAINGNNPIPSKNEVFKVKKEKQVLHKFHPIGQKGGVKIKRPSPLVYHLV